MTTATSPSAEMVVYLYFSVAISALAAIPIILLKALRLEQPPKQQFKDFIAMLKSGPIAHRAGTPENTLAGLRKAKEEGASAVEVDLEFSRDGHPVLLHDSTVNRTSNGSGRVSDLTLEELKMLDFGVKFGNAHEGECIPTVYEAIDHCQKYNMLMLLELKSGFSNADRAVSVVKKLFSERPDLYAKIAIISFYPNVLYKLRQADPNLLLGLTIRRYWLSTLPNGERRHKQLWKYLLAVPLDWLLGWCLEAWVWRVIGANLMIAHKGSILGDENFIPTWESRGYYVIGWTVNAEEEKQHFKTVLKVPYITDDVIYNSSATEQST